MSERMKRERIIFYLPYDFGNLESGSRVRPYKMYEAFMHLGYEVDLIVGGPHERIEQYKKVRASKKRYNFCYCEAGTYPLNPIVDYRILLGIRRLGVPMGVYYRDAYWKFPDYFHYRGRKRLELLFRYHADQFLFSKVASAIFFPTASLANLFNLRPKKVVLPPGGEYIPIKRALTQPLQAVYVGGVTQRYGIELMLKALHLVNQEETVIILNLVCRQRELESLPEAIKRLMQVPWVKINHISGDDLKSVYSNSHIGLVPLVKDAYNDLALPVKLFEYLSFGLPVVVTNCKEMQNFVEKFGCGIVSTDDVLSLANTLRSLVKHPDTLQTLSDRAVKAILSGNRWTDRAKAVADVLTSSSTGRVN